MVSVMKDPKKQKAGRARWLSMSAKERKQFTSKAGKKGGAKTREVWKRLKAGEVIHMGTLDLSSTKI